MMPRVPLALQAVLVSMPPPPLSLAWQGHSAVEGWTTVGHAIWGLTLLRRETKSALPALPAIPARPLMLPLCLVLPVVGP